MRAQGESLWSGTEDKPLSSRRAGDAYQIRAIRMTWMKPQNLKKSHSPKLHIARLHVYEVSRKGKNYRDRKYRVGGKNRDRQQGDIGKFGGDDEVF